MYQFAIKAISNLVQMSFETMIYHLLSVIFNNVRHLQQYGAIMIYANLLAAVGKE